MNFCQYVATISNYSNVFVRTIPSQLSLTACRSRLLCLVRPHSLCSSQTLSLNLRRYLQVKAGKKKLFSGNHKMDKVPDQFSVIYNSSLGPWFTFFRIGTATIFGTLAVAYYHVLPEISKEFFLTSKGFFFGGSTITLFILIVGFSISARRFFTRIYFHQDSGSFVGVRRDLFGRLKQLKYTIEDVKHSGLQNVQSKDGGETTTVSIKGQTMNLQGNNFISPVFYNMHISGASAVSEYVQDPKF